MVQKYIEKLCEMLEIPIPKVFFGGYGFRGGRLAELSSDGGSLYLKRQKTCSLDQLFGIAAELRDFSRHKRGKEPSMTDSYAFAAIAVSRFYEVEPLFDELTFVEREKIACRRREILKEEFPYLQ